MEKIKLLLVDDHQIVLDGLCAFLEKAPRMEITGTALSGEKALELMQQQPADVVVLDISMPNGMNGIDTAKALKSSYPNTKIILLTMHGESRYIIQALRKGIHGYVMKEKSKETLLSAIHAVLNKNRYFPPDLIDRLEDATDEEEGPNATANTVELTHREKEIICLMAREPHLTAKQVADRLRIATYTVQTHIRNAKEKLGMGRTQELVMYAVEQKLCGGKAGTSNGLP